MPIAKYLKKFPSVLFPKKWNSLGNALKASKSEKSLKRNFKKQTINRYKSFKCKKENILHLKSHNSSYKFTLCSVIAIIYLLTLL